MKSYKRFAAIASILAAVLGIAACGGTTVVKVQTAPHTTPQTSNSYPEAVQHAYLVSCLKGAGSTGTITQTQKNNYCGCTLNYLEQNVSLSAVASYTTGSKPSWLNAAITTCLPKLEG